MTDYFSNLTIDRQDDGTLILEQDCSGTICSVAIHPAQLRHMAEMSGLVESSDPQAAKTIATLTRRLLVLKKRIAHLADYLTTCSDRQHADLDYEVEYATATADIADEFVAELEDAQVVTEPPKQPAEHTKQKTGADTRQLTIEV